MVTPVAGLGASLPTHFVTLARGDVPAAFFVTTVNWYDALLATVTGTVTDAPAVVVPVAASTPFTLTVYVSSPSRAAPAYVVVGAVNATLPVSDSPAKSTVMFVALAGAPSSARSCGITIPTIPVVPSKSPSFVAVPVERSTEYSPVFADASMAAQ